MRIHGHHGSAQLTKQPGSSEATVQVGEGTLAQVAKRLGLRLEDLKLSNPNLAKEGLVKPGQVIALPPTQAKQRLGAARQESGPDSSVKPGRPAGETLQGSSLEKSLFQARFVKPEEDSVAQGQYSKQQLEALVGALQADPKQTLDALMQNHYQGRPGLVRAGQGELTEIMRQLSGSDSPEMNKAYNQILGAVKERFDNKEFGTRDWPESTFIQEVAKSSGPGSQRLKADMARIVAANYDKASKAESSGVGQVYKNLAAQQLGDLLGSDPSGIVANLRREPEQMDKMLSALLQDHPSGAKVVGKMIGDLAGDHARALQSGDETAIRRHGSDLGWMIGEAENAVQTSAENAKEAAEKGAKILKFATAGLGMILPGAVKELGGEALDEMVEGVSAKEVAGPYLEKVGDGIDKLEGSSPDSVEEARQKFHRLAFRLADDGFDAMIDPSQTMRIAPPESKDYKTFDQLDSWGRESRQNGYDEARSAKR